MNKPGRSKDIIDFVEKLAAQSGHIEAVDEDYYRAFLELTQPQIEKLAVAVMLDHERDLRQLAGGRNNPASVARVSELVRNIFTAISIGVARFDAFGRLVLVSRVGFDPTEETSEAMERRYEEIAPIIENIVRRTLPWLLSREITQGQLPL
ncbi:MAG: hypothetical protein IT190_08005 [Microbacteriaceae bacterium]|nr:hypothetical protein [Microbacteriaceae bacterium]